MMGQSIKGGAAMSSKLAGNIWGEILTIRLMAFWSCAGFRVK